MFQDTKNLEQAIFKAVKLGAKYYSRYAVNGSLISVSFFNGAVALNLKECQEINPSVVSISSDSKILHEVCHYLVDMQSLNSINRLNGINTTNLTKIDQYYFN